MNTKHLSAILAELKSNCNPFAEVVEFVTRHSNSLSYLAANLTELTEAVIKDAEEESARLRRMFAAVKAVVAESE